MATIYRWSLVLKYAKTGNPFAQPGGSTAPILTCQGQLSQPQTPDGWRIVAKGVEIQRSLLKSSSSDESLYLYLALTHVDGRISAEDVCMVFSLEEEEEEQLVSPMRFTSHWAADRIISKGGHVTGDAVFDFGKKEFTINVHRSH